MNVQSALEKMTYRIVMGDPDVEVSEVIYDSRKAGPDCVFVCMRGARVDSHAFIDDVIQKGCRVLVIEEELDQEQLVRLPEDVTVLQAESAREALAYLSAERFDHPSRKMVCIGVTGTKGKTTTTYMIKAILEAAGKKVGLIGTAGAVIGDQTYPTANTTPESYQLQQYFAQMVEAGCEYMIMEVSSQGLKMHRVDGIFFDYGLFTNISPDHIGPDEHADFEEYLYFKSQMLQRCKVGLVNRDDEYYELIRSQATCRLYTYSLEQTADFMAQEIQYLAGPEFVGLDFEVRGMYDLRVKVNIAGRFNVYNALAAAAVCSFCDLPKEKIAHALEHLYVNGRMEIVHTSKRCTVIVDYAHNAVSMESLLRTLRDYHPKRLVCVFGCGGNRSKERRYSMGEIGGKLADLCILTADNSRYEKTEDIIADIRGSIEKTGGAYLEIPDRRDAIEYSIVHAQPGDMIAVIGKGHEDYQEINGVRTPFLDRAVIEEIVARLEKEETSENMVTVHEIVEACGGTLLCGEAEAPITGICLNSKEVKNDELFVPLVGERVDAHRFIGAALEQGAGAVLTAEHEQVPEDGNQQKAWIRVEDTKQALQRIGSYCRSQLQMPIVGVTGSVGKTTTREMIAAALSAGYQVHKTPGNRNSQVGLPITLFQFYQNAGKTKEIGVLELGMSEPGEMSVIARIAKADMAVITNIGIAHIEQLGSQENIRTEKLAIQDGMKDGGVLFLNGDDPLLKEIKAKDGCQTIYYGTGENCDYRAVEIRMEEGYPVFTALCRGQKLPVKLQVPGMHQVLNAMAALAVADQQGVELEAAVRELEAFGGYQNRQQIYELGEITLIDDTYNASPVSMCGAIDILASMKKAARRIAVLADMKELGADTLRYHREVGQHLGRCAVDVLVTYGELARAIEQGALETNPSLTVVNLNELEEVKQWIISEKKAGDAILLKGSNSMKLGEAAEYVCQCHH